MTNGYMVDEANMKSGVNEYSQGAAYMLVSKACDDKNTWAPPRLDGGGWYL